MPAGTMYARKAWQEVGGYPELMKYGREDWAMNIKLGWHGWCGYHVGQSGNLYRREGQNRSLRTGNVHKGESGEGFSWRRTFMEQLHALFPRAYAGERPPMCCGDSRTKKTTPVTRSGAVPSAALESKSQAQALADAQALAADPGMAFLEYIGGNDGNTPWYGPVTGTRYTFGKGRPVGQVYAEDVPGMVNIRRHTKPVFRRWRPPQALTPKQPIEVPIEIEQVANPTEPDDLTAIAGVGAATAKKLVDGGYATFLALARAAAEQVAEDTGVSLRAAEKATVGARAFASGGRDRLTGEAGA